MISFSDDPKFRLRLRQFRELKTIQTNERNHKDNVYYIALMTTTTTSKGFHQNLTRKVKWEALEVRSVMFM